jgi:hypothetical protein
MESGVMPPHSIFPLAPKRRFEYKGAAVDAKTQG